MYPLICKLYIDPLHKFNHKKRVTVEMYRASFARLWAKRSNSTGCYSGALQ